MALDSNLAVGTISSGDLVKVGGIRPFLALALLVSSAAVGLNSEVINDTIRSSPETEESSDSNIVGLYSDEKWPYSGSKCLTNHFQIP